MHIVSKRVNFVAEKENAKNVILRLAIIVKFTLANHTVLLSKHAKPIIITHQQASRSKNTDSLTIGNGEEDDLKREWSFIHLSGSIVHCVS